MQFDEYTDAELNLSQAATIGEKPRAAADDDYTEAEMILLQPPSGYGEETSEDDYSMAEINHSHAKPPLQHSHAIQVSLKTPVGLQLYLTYRCH